MRLEKVLLAHAGRFLTLANPTLYVRDVVRALEERYGFVQVPRSAEELMPEQGQPILFHHGRFIRNEQTIVIHKLQLYQQAIVAETTTSTDDADLIVEDMIQAGRERGWILTSAPARLYLSQLEVRLDSTLDRAFPASGQLSQRLLEAIGRYEFAVKIPAPKVVSIIMQPDPRQQQMHSDFRIERREGASYDDNLHFSQAPLRTADHIAVLEEFDRVAVAANRPNA